MWKRGVKTKLLVAFISVFITGTNLYAVYCPDTGRFLSRDPIDEPGFQTNALATGDVTLLNALVNKKFEPEYTFVKNDPVNKFDALGLSFWDYVPVIAAIRTGWMTWPGMKKEDYSGCKVTKEECKKCNDAGQSYVTSESVGEKRCKKDIEAKKAVFIAQTLTPGKFGVDIALVAGGGISWFTPARAIGIGAVIIGGADTVATGPVYAIASNKMNAAMGEAIKEYCDCAKAKK